MGILHTLFHMALKPTVPLSVATSLLVSSRVLLAFTTQGHFSVTLVHVF